MVGGLLASPCTLNGSGYEGVCVGPAPSSLTYLEFLHRWVSTTSAVEYILCPTHDRSKVSERGKFKQKGNFLFNEHTFYCPS